jgi:hypothetical protein
MKFNLGQYRKIVGGATYIKDTYQIQVDPEPVAETPTPEEEPQIEVKMSGEPSLAPIIEETKKEDNESVRRKQVDEGQPTKQAPKRKPRQRARKSNS